MQVDFTYGSNYNKYVSYMEESDFGRLGWGVKFFYLICSSLVVVKLDYCMFYYLKVRKGDLVDGWWEFFY